MRQMQGTDDKETQNDTVEVTQHSPKDALFLNQNEWYVSLLNESKGTDHLSYST